MFMGYLTMGILWFVILFSTLSFVNKDEKKKKNKETNLEELSS